MPNHLQISQATFKLSKTLVAAIALMAMFSSLANAQTNGECASCGASTPSFESAYTAVPQYAPDQYATTQYAPQYAGGPYGGYGSQCASCQGYAGNGDVSNRCANCGQQCGSQPQGPLCTPPVRKYFTEYSPKWHDNPVFTPRPRRAWFAQDANRGNYYWGNYVPGGRSAYYGYNNFTN